LKKDRIDVLLVENGFFRSRERAKTALMEGVVFVDGQRIDKAGTKVAEDAEITVKGDDCPYVSRGGYKLEKAIGSFGIDLKDKVCVDIGASTGGFTDVMLQNGARRVYAVDVGYGQLDWKLRNDERVVNMEKCNVRYLDPDSLPEKAGFCSCDVSFISLKLVFPVMTKLLAEDGRAACLIKPQFEAGKQEADRYKGVIRDPAIWERVILETIENAAENGLYMNGLDFSPIKGAKGNTEFLISLVKVEKLGYNKTRVLKTVHDIVEQATETLG